MCWLLQGLGGAGFLAGVVILVLAFFGPGQSLSEHSSEANPTPLMLGAALMVMGALLAALGFVQGVCQAIGLA